MEPDDEGKTQRDRKPTEKTKQAKKKKKVLRRLWRREKMRNERKVSYIGAALDDAKLARGNGPGKKSRTEDAQLRELRIGESRKQDEGESPCT